jgi:hypothetical protein
MAAKDIEIGRDGFAGDDSLIPDFKDFIEP